MFGIGLFIGAASWAGGDGFWKPLVLSTGGLLVGSVVLTTISVIHHGHHGERWDSSRSE
jgi:hypothetical protein